MYINSIHIEKYKVLGDLKIEFQIPENSTLQNGNIVNVIAGVNGSGKTSLLELLFGIFGIYSYTDVLKPFKRKEIVLKEIVCDFIEESSFGNLDLFFSKIDKFTSQQIKKNIYKNGVHSSSRIIYLPSKMSFEYKATAQLDSSYIFANKIDPSKILGNAELFIKNYVISKERESRKSAPEERTEDAIKSFNSIFENSEFVTKLIDLDNFNDNRPVFQTINGDRVTIDKLSSGEQQLYARVVSLMILNPHNSIILIDEPEIALHPKWQTEIMKIYSNIGKNNQFIVTTHSPFIISQTHYKNLIFLLKESDNIVAKQFIKPNNRDINTIIETMGASCENSEVAKLHQEYRELFSQNLEDSEKGVEKRAEILEWESDNSKFFQSMSLQKKLKERKRR
jgi:predicted ATP-dependent endonuclease of OLD family